MSKLQIPIEHTQLENGLRVVVVPDRTAPVVTVGVYYNIGFRLEPQGRSGFEQCIESIAKDQAPHGEDDEGLLIQSQAFPDDAPGVRVRRGEPGRIDPVGQELDLAITRRKLLSITGGMCADGGDFCRAAQRIPTQGGIRHVLD